MTAKGWHHLGVAISLGEKLHLPTWTDLASLQKAVLRLGWGKCLLILNAPFHFIKNYRLLIMPTPLSFIFCIASWQHNLKLNASFILVFPSVIREVNLKYCKQYNIKVVCCRFNSQSFCWLYWQLLICLLHYSKWDWNGQLFLINSHNLFRCFYSWKVFLLFLSQKN